MGKKKKKDKLKSTCLNCNEKFDGKREFCTPRCKKINQCKAKGNAGFLRSVLAPLFQRMIRAEWGSEATGYKIAVKNNQIVSVHRHRGQCVCITCGSIYAWDSGIKGMHTGHFAASRRNSILLLEDNVAPQCAGCNFYRDGAPVEFRLWMETVRGEQVIDRILKLKTESVTFSTDELVDRWFEYSLRLKAAKERMKRSE